MGIWRQDVTFSVIREQSNDKDSMLCDVCWASSGENLYLVCYVVKEMTTQMFMGNR